MGLRIQPKRFGIKLATFMAVFAFVLQPMYGLVASQVANAVSGIVITNETELRSAIENQADGQTWTIQPGTYAVTQTNAITAGGQTGWYFPIVKDNITISGVGNPTIYGSGYTANGSWATQDLVAIFGNNVTIKNLTLQNKVESNKVVEVLGNNSTIQSVAIKDSAAAGEWNGSIYYNDDSGANQTTQTLKNITVNNGGVSAHAPNATINIDNVNFVYKSSTDWINQYRFYKPYSTTVVNGTPNYTYQVSNALNNIGVALDSVNASDSVAGHETIQLISDLYASHQITIDKDNLTVNGKKPAGGYYTIFGNYDKTDGSNNSVLSVQADGVRLNELNIDGRNHQLHGINVYGAQDLQTWRMTVKNNAFSGLNINRSWVQGVDLTTENNGWHGVDIDGPGSVFQGAGINHHSETLLHTDNGKTKPVPALYVDNVTVGTVNDTNDQYTHVDNYWNTGDRAYFLKSDVQAVKNLTIKYQNDATSLANGATVNQVSKPGNNNLVLNFDKPVSPAVVDHYITTETRPDGTSENVWNGFNNTWLTAGKDAVGSNDSRAEFGYHGNGEYTYTVTVYYKNGTSAASDTTSLWFDNQSPVTAFVDAPTNNSFVNGNFHVSATASDSARLKNVLFDVRDPQDTTGNAYRAGCVAGTMNLTYGADNKTATLDCTINTAGLVEGRQYVVRVHASDYAGYGSAVTNSVRTFTVDRTAPADPTLVSPHDNAFVNGASVTQSWSDASSDVDHYIYESYTDAGATNVRWHEEISSTSKTATNVANATYWWRVKAVDAAGNKSDWSQLWKLTIDNTVPTTPVINSPSDGAFFNTLPILNKWTAATDANGVTGYQVAYRYDDGHTFTNSTCPGLTIGGLAVSGCRDTTATQRNHAPAANEQGGVTVWVRAVDAAGNYSAWSASVHYTYDKTAPVVAIPSYTTLSNVITPNVTADDANSPLAYTWTQTAGPTTGVTISDPAVIKPTFTVTEDGTYTFKLTATDPAGNVSTSTFSFTYTAPVNPVTPLTPVTPAVISTDQTPATGDGFTAVAVASDGDNGTAVLGAQTENDSSKAKDSKSNQSILGATATPTAENSAFALAWYWWLLIVAAVVAAGWWFIAAARRRRDGDDA